MHAFKPNAYDLLLSISSKGNWSSQLSKQICAIVFLMHLMALVIIVPTYQRQEKRTSHKLVVTTIALNPSIQESTHTTQPPLVEPNQALIAQIPSLEEDLAKEETLAKEKHKSPEPAQIDTTPIVQSDPLPTPPKSKPQHVPAKPKPPAPSPKPQPKQQPKVHKPKAQTKPTPAKKPAATKTSPSIASSKPAHQKKVASKQSAQSARSNKQQALLAEALHSLDQFGSVKQQVSSRLSSQNSESSNPKLKTINNLSIANTSHGNADALSKAERTYIDELVSRLKLSLKLPEFGDVKIQLTITKFGKVTQLKVIQAKSDKNQQYVEKTIPSIAFPSFGANFPQESQHTFHLTLSNEP